MMTQEAIRSADKPRRFVRNRQRGDLRILLMKVEQV
jgi:hypothetical protein